MPQKIIQRLVKLRQTARQKQQFVVDSAAAQLIEQPHCLDGRINLVGALHEVGSLRNTLTPYWRELRVDEAAWAQRCIARLVGNDHDYWALAALLACPAGLVLAQARLQGFQVVAVRAYERYDLPPVHVASMAVDKGDLLAPLLELGWDMEKEELVDCVRARAVLLHSREIVGGSLVGEGTMSYFCRATLPHGSWRSVSLPFVISADEVVEGACPDPSFRSA